MPRKRNQIAKEGILTSVNSVEELLLQADAHIDTFEYETALGFCQRALELNPNHGKALETYSNVLLEVGNFKKAKECLQKAVAISPDLGHAKYFSLSQLENGFESLNLYKKGIEILKKELEIFENLESTSEAENNSAVTFKNKPQLKRKLSNAYCSIVELFMTDLCDEDNAENECAIQIEHAITADETNPEAYQCKANLVMVRNNTEEAKQLMTKSLSLWLPRTKELLSNQTETNEECPLSSEARISCVKLLIELQEFEPASDVLDSLLTENDECIEVWYLYGLLNYLKEDDEDARTRARYYLTKAKRLIEKFGDEDEAEMKDHVAEMLQELGGEAEESDDENISDNENEITSSSEEEEMET
ncbi:hypothetical protein CHUAL_004634 [Chamberlinius hualienensis]